MGYDVSGFVFSQEPNWEAFQSLPVHLGIRGYRHQTQPVCLLDVWKCVPGEHGPMTGWLPEEYQPVTVLPHETVHLLGQLQAIAAAIQATEPVDHLAAVSWSAAISEMCGLETTFYAANDDTINMAARWNAGRLQALRLTFGQFLITHQSQSGLLVQQVISLEDDPPRECPPSVDKPLRLIPGVTVGAPLTVETAAGLHSNALALWPESAAFAQPMLGVGCWDAQPEAWQEWIVRFERGCPAPADLCPSLDLEDILGRAQSEAAGILKSDQPPDAWQPLAALGFDELDAMQLVMTLEQTYWVKIPDAQLVEHGTVEQSLTLRRLAELILNAALPPAGPPVPPAAPPLLAKPRSSNPRWLWIGLWVLIFCAVGGVVSLLLLGPVGIILQAVALIKAPSELGSLAKVIPLIAAGIAVWQGLLGRLPGTKHER